MFKNCDCLEYLIIYNENHNDDRFDKYIKFAKNERFSENDVNNEYNEHSIYKNLKK